MALQKRPSNSLITSFCSAASTSNDDTIRPTERTESSASVDSFVTTKSVLNAEILWALKCVKSHFSYNSCQGNRELFSKMFPDSVIAKKFSLGERKCSYLISFGLAPFLKDILVKNLDNVSNIVLLFDETLNKTNQTKQLDIHLRYWDINESVVVTRYFSSAFLGHSTAVDLLKEFLNVVEKLDLSKLIQISMDGPAVNWSFFNSLKKELLNEFNCQFADIGSCGIHILNNAFRKGATSTDWNVSSVLVSLSWLLKDSPARRDDFIETSKLKKFPVKFCNCRWLENGPAADRALLIWDDIKEYTKQVSLGKFPKITNKTFLTVYEATQDKLFPVKLQFFSCVAKILQPFLKVYQSDEPLLPFFAGDIFKLIVHCLQLFNIIKTEELCRISSVERLCKYNFKEKASYSPICKVSAGFVADKMLSHLLQKKEISDGEHLSFRHECQLFVVNFIQNLLEKCPIKYTFVRNASCINPKEMVLEEGKANNKMKCVLLYLSQINKVQDQLCDTILLEFKDFTQTVVPEFRSDFKNFDHNSMRLDTFLSKYIAGNKRFVNVWEVMKMIMIMSHGQASVERGFSVNKKIEVENLKDLSYISQRLVYDYLKVSGDIANIQISDEMRKAASAARMKYDQYLDDQKREKSNSAASNKRKSILEEIHYIKNKRACLETDVSGLQSSAESFAEKAEASRDINLFIKSNDFRKMAGEKKEEIKILNKTLEEKENLLHSANS